MMNNMREDWIECKLGDLLILSNEKHKPLKKEKIFYVGLEHIQKSTGSLKESVGIAEITTVKNKFSQGQILYGKLRPYFNKVYLAKEDGVCSTDILVFSVSNDIEDKYALHYMLSRKFVNDMSENTNGVSLPRVSTKYVTTYKFPLAPLPIQRAIVSKIEALFSDLDNGIANFKKAQEQLKIYRQAVLKKAFEGELTKEWREKQTNLPTAEELLKQIKEERQNHYNQQIEDWKKAVKEWEKKGSVGKKPSKPIQPKELPPLKKDELEEFPILPNGWVWCRNLNVSTKITDGEHITPKREKSGYYLLSARNIQNGYISYTNVDYVGEDEYLRIRKRCNPEFGDILISCSGSVGRISLVPKNYNFRSVALVKTNVKIYNPKFLEYLFLSPELQSQIEDGKKATAQANLFLEPIGKLNVIICSLEEQNQIVQEIESRLSVCDKMEQSIRESIEKAEALRQSILKKAFEGKLLSEAEIALCKQEADYEPASELLKKIQAEKLAKEQEKKKPILKKKGKK